MEKKSGKKAASRKAANLGKAKAAVAGSFRDNKPAGKDGLPIVPIIAILAVIIVAIIGMRAFAQQGPAPANLDGKNSTITPVENPLDSPGAIALVGSFDKLSGIPDEFSLTFTEKIDNVASNVTLLKRAGERMAMVQSPYHTRRYVWESDGKVLMCERELGGEEACAYITNTSRYMRETAKLNATFPYKGDALLQKNNTIKLIGLGAIMFSAPPQKTEIAGRACENIVYSLDYGRLSQKQLDQIDRSQLVFGNYKLEKCVDAATGISLRSKLRYDYMGRTITYEHTYTSFEPNPKMEIIKPGQFEQAQRVEAMADSDNALLAAMGECKEIENATQRDLCIGKSAITNRNFKVCYYVENQAHEDECIMRVAIASNDYTVCEKAGALKNDCYANMALARNDKSFCTMVLNATLKQECMSIFEQAAASNMTTGAG